MKRIVVVALALVVLVPGGYAAAQVAGSTRLGVAVEEMKAVALGWSVKKQIMGQSVYNEQNQRVGKIDDLITQIRRLAARLSAAELEDRRSKFIQATASLDAEAVRARAAFSPQHRAPRKEQSSRELRERAVIIKKGYVRACEALNASPNQIDESKSNMAAAIRVQAAELEKGLPQPRKSFDDKWEPDKLIDAADGAIQSANAELDAKALELTRRSSERVWRWFMRGVQFVISVFRTFVAGTT